MDENEESKDEVREAPPRMPRPGNPILVRLAEIVTHVEVMVKPGYDAFNKDHIRVLLQDSMMQEWLKDMHKLGMIPDNARNPHAKTKRLPSPVDTPGHKWFGDSSSTESPTTGDLIGREFITAATGELAVAAVKAAFPEVVIPVTPQILGPATE